MINSEEANKYYNLINKYIDDYLDNWKIAPKNLKKYLNTNRISNFLEKKGLKGINNLNRVITDVIDDRIAIENDKVLKFESFKFFESSEYKISEISQCLYKGINKSNIEHEKIIADQFDVSLSQIDIVDSDLHKFKIENEEYFIYNQEEVEIIKENLKEWALEKTLNEYVEIDMMSKKLKLQIKDIIDRDKLEESISLELNDVKWIIGSILKCKTIWKDEKYFLGIL